MALYRQGLTSFAHEVTTDGVGIGGGFIAAGVVGRQVENLVMKNPVSSGSPMSDKLLAWAANNGSKAILYILMKTYDAGSSITREAAKTMAGSVVYDSILRVANGGVNPADISIGGYRVMGQGMEPEKVQKLVQENSLLRTELNKALQRLASYNPDRPDARGDFRYGGEVSPAVAERQRKFGAMPNTADVYERQRRFGAMPQQGLPFEQNPEKTARQRRFGAMEQMGFMPDAKDTSVAKMFNMQ